MAAAVSLAEAEAAAEAEAGSGGRKSACMDNAYAGTSKLCRIQLCILALE